MSTDMTAQAATDGATVTTQSRSVGWLGSRILRGLAEAPHEYRAWRQATEYDDAIAIARDAKDQTKLIIAQDRKAAAVKARRGAAAWFWAAAAPVLFGGWFWATLMAGLVLVVAIVAHQRITKVPGSITARAGLAFAVSLGVELTDAALGMHPHVRLGDWAWHPWLLSWPALALLAGLVKLIIWVGPDGSIADNLRDESAPKDAKPDTIEAAVIASVKGLDPESRPFVVPPGVVWAPDRSSWSATVDTGGPSAARLIPVRGDLAARLDLGPTRLHMLIDDDRASRARLTGVPGDPWARQADSPLMGVDSVDLWRPLPFAVDLTGAPVSLSIPGSNFLFGGMPNYGKSTAAADVWAAFVLSKSSRIWVIDGGEVDTEPVHRAGLTHRWCTAPEEAVEILREVNTEISVRQEAIAAAGKRKVDREFFAQHGGGLDLLMWDEVASYTDNADAKLAKEITRLAKSALQRCRKAGIILLLSTQSPSAGALDSDARDVVHWRWAGWCRTRQMSDKILGEGSATRGVDASQLDRRVKGVGWLSAEDGDRIVRPHYLSESDVAEIIRRGQVLRGVTPEKPAVDILAAVAGVMRARGVDWISAEDLIASGGMFEAMDAMSLALALSPHNVRTAQIAEERNRRRYRLDDVERALRKAS